MARRESGSVHCLDYDHYTKALFMFNGSKQGNELYRNGRMTMSLYIAAEIRRGIHLHIRIKRTCSSGCNNDYW